ncbi:Utp14-domain-containing protein [Aureobasidium pullulans]|uniref:Utp14-domain-containing protein n=1 Tax=Aureobasidium pullulans TaxID=5580 RepID=A0A4T0C6W0_AURPU|nr:Utp14-domain-containing protein [Aureobasidium pullulans]
MPARVARSSVAIAKPTNARKKSQKRTLDAFAIASHSAPETYKVRQHRLGDSVGEPRQKRRRLEDDDEDDNDEEHASNARRLQQKTVTKRTGTGRRGGLDEETDEGSDSDGNEWRMGGHIGDESDSDLDSDEAFGESDEERFEGFTFRGSSTNGPSKKKKKRPQPTSEMDLDEGGNSEDDESASDFGDEGVDLATMLDENNEDDLMQTEEKHGDDSEEDSDDEDDDAEEESEDDESEEESDEDDATKLSKLQDLVASLNKDNPEKRIGGRTQDAHESQEPSAYGLSASQKLKISDLLPTVTDPALRKSLKLLTAEKTTKRSGIPGKLDAPLPKRQQDKLDRAAATQETKKTLDRWRDTVIQNRRAEFLQFPLADPNAIEAVGTQKMLPIQQDKPANELESAIQNILEESGLSNKQKQGKEEDQLQQFEELQMNKIPIEEVMARRAELRKARELLFREEVKAKRVKKIKSKAYRRVHRKERERAEAAERDYLVAEGIEDEDEKEKNDRRRAEERMGTKHKDSKWSKAMKKSNRSVWDEDAREGLIDMARRNEELRRRIEGKDVYDRESDDSDISVSDDEDEELDDDELERARLFKKIDKLGAKDGEKSKIGNMAFMLRAEASRKAQNEEDIERLRKDLADEAGESEEEAETSVGRAIFGPKPKQGAANPFKATPRGELEENKALDGEDNREMEDEAEIKVGEQKDTKPAPQSRKSRSFLQNAQKVVADVDEPKEPEENAWLTGSSKSKKKNKKASEDEILDLSKPTPASVPAAAKPAASNKKAQAKKTTKPSANETNAPSTEGWETVKYDNDQEEADAEEDNRINPMLSSKDKQALFHQRAFAGDDVAADFSTEKEAAIEDEGDKVESTFLPGWGSWTGDGLSKAVKKQNKRAAHNPLHKKVTEGVKAANRKDAKLQNVIISEAQQRKGKKYLASTLPHQFEKREQYERSLRVPVGPEWTTKETFQRNTRPRVVVKQGIIAPMEKPLL